MGIPAPKNWRIPQPIHARSETMDNLKTFKSAFLDPSDWATWLRFSTVPLLFTLVSVLVGCGKEEPPRPGAAAFCRMMDKYFHLSEPCNISGLTISIREQDMDASEASKFCADLAKNSIKGAPGLAGYTLKVYTPFTGEHPLATCTF
jgi:hypothetical protein